MLKSKICFTVFVLYEIIAVILLHCPRTCDAMFSGAFCNDSVFKYFLICAAIPMLALVIGIWINEIFFARRHRSFMHRARDVMDDVADGVKKHLGRAFDARDMDKYLAAAILFGIKKYSDRHPQMRNTIRDIMDGADGRTTVYDDADDIDDDYEDTDSDDDYVAQSDRRTSRPHASRGRASASRQSTVTSKSRTMSGGTRRKAR